MSLACFKIVLLNVVLSWILSGCATLPATPAGFSSFSSYAETVFRHQNEVSSRLMMLNDTDQLPDDENFERAEEVMTDACQLLNEYAEREKSKESMGWRFKRKVQKSVAGCDASIQQMEALLNKLDVER